MKYFPFVLYSLALLATIYVGIKTQEALQTISEFGVTTSVIVAIFLFIPVFIPLVAEVIKISFWLNAGNLILVTSSIALSLFSFYTAHGDYSGAIIGFLPAFLLWPFNIIGYFVGRTIQRN